MGGHSSDYGGTLPHMYGFVTTDDAVDNRGWYMCGSLHYQGR